MNTNIKMHKVVLAAPFNIDTPPVEDFGKNVPQGECEFSNATTFCVIFRLDLSQRE